MLEQQEREKKEKKSALEKSFSLPRLSSTILSWAVLPQLRKNPYIYHWYGAVYTKNHTFNELISQRTKRFQDFISFEEVTQLNSRVEEKEGEWRRGEEEQKREV